MCLKGAEATPFYRKVVLEGLLASLMPHTSKVKPRSLTRMSVRTDGLLSTEEHTGVRQGRDFPALLGTVQIRGREGWGDSVEKVGAMVCVCKQETEFSDGVSEDKEQGPGAMGLGPCYISSGVLEADPASTSE